MENRGTKNPRDGRTGLVMVVTGEGKGKTTASLGMLLRAWGLDMDVAFLQFIKKSDSDYGEHRAMRRLGIEFITMGAGFTWVGEIGRAHV
jgi:cob(I)alamin adenosyltransferase